MVLDILTITGHLSGTDGCHGECLRAQEGTLTPKDVGFGVLTLTGWSAVLGVFALIAVVIAGAVFGWRRYKGYDRMTTYTKVAKGERAAGGA